MKMAASTIDISEFKTKIVSSLSVLILREFSIKVISFIGQIFLTRLLVPEDFGIFAIIAFVVNFSGLFADIGLPWAIIQRKKEPTDTDLSTVFWIKILLTFCIVVFISFFSFLLPRFYHSFTTAQIVMTQVFAVSLLFTALKAVPAVLLERAINYYKISWIEIGGVVIYQIVTVTAAVQGFGPWSLIIGVLTKELTEMILAFALQPWWPKSFISKTSLRSMLKFGAYIQGNAVVNFIHSSLIPVVIGIKSGPYAVGILDWAQNIAAIPNTITDNYGRVAFSGFSRIQDNIELLRSAIGKSMSLLSAITLFFTVMTLGFGRQLVEIVFTSKWEAGIPVLYWFSANTFFVAVMAALGAGILVNGHSKKILYANVLTKIVEWILVFLLLPTFSFTSIAIASTGTSLLSFAAYLWIGQELAIVPDLQKVLLPKIWIVIVTLLVITLINIIFPVHFGWLILKIAIATLTYGISLIVFSRRDFDDAVQLSKHYFLERSI